MASGIQVKNVSQDEGQEMNQEDRDMLTSTEPQPGGDEPEMPQETRGGGQSTLTSLRTASEAREGAVASWL